MTPADTADPRVAGWAGQVMAAIDAHVKEGRVPPGVASFARLHDYVDANMYVIEALAGAEFPRAPADDPEVLAGQAETAAANAVMDEVNRRLTARRPDGFCRTCGDPVGPADKCSCWGRVAEALQRYLGMDFDAAALLASRLWDDQADKPHVWTAGYANDHDGAEVYDPPAPLAALQGADALAFPHDDPCPRCGRRQWWWLDNAPAVCICGYEHEGA